jgi:hypothetical protein
MFHPVFEPLGAKFKINNDRDSAGDFLLAAFSAKRLCRDGWTLMPGPHSEPANDADTPALKALGSAYSEAP